MITCRCGAHWTGVSRAHCGACHETLNSVSLFDRHRVGDSCLPAASLGFVLASGVWRDRRRSVEARERHAERKAGESS